MTTEYIIEPCCYNKQLNEFLSSSPLDVIPVFHNGDILSSHLFERCGVMARPGSTLWVVLPQIQDCTVREIQRLSALKAYNPETGRSELVFDTINIITRQPGSSLLSVTAKEGQTINIAKEPQLGMRLIGFTGALPKNNLLVTGSIIQSIQFGAHLLEFHRGEQISFLVPYLSRQIRFHKV